MLILFPSDPMYPKVVDSDYRTEFDNAHRHGFDLGLINLEDLIAGDVSSAINRF